MSNPPLHLLDNVMWNCLSGSHARFAQGCGPTRRYATGFSPIIGFENPAQADLSAIEAFATTSEQFYCEQWTGEAPAGWQVLQEAKMLRMYDTGRKPVNATQGDAVALTPAHVPQAMALATLMRPGPFGPRTIELGDYVGIFSGHDLVAMAGERMQVGSWREISGVCCAPGYEGRGLAADLMRLLLSRQRARGERTFLNVMSSNTRARALYEHLGFEVYRESTVRVVTRL